MKTFKQYFIKEGHTYTYVTKDIDKMPLHELLILIHEMQYKYYKLPRNKKHNIINMFSKVFKKINDILINKLLDIKAEIYSNIQEIKDDPETGGGRYDINDSENDKKEQIEYDMEAYNRWLGYINEYIDNIDYNKGIEHNMHLITMLLHAVHYEEEFLKSFEILNAEQLYQLSNLNTDKWDKEIKEEEKFDI